MNDAHAKKHEFVDSTNNVRKYKNDAHAKKNQYRIITNQYERRNEYIYFDINASDALIAPNTLKTHHKES